MNFYPYSSIRIPRSDNGLVAGDHDSLATFWQYVNENYEEGLADAVGCYIFAIRAGKGILPWYVGKAEKSSFRNECFKPHKLNHYNQAIAGRKGTPLITLVAKFTGGYNNYAKPSSSGHRDIDTLEKMLISACVKRNANLLNIRDTKLLREMVVPGFLNNPKGGDGQFVRDFRGLIGA